MLGDALDMAGRLKEGVRALKAGDGGGDGGGSGGGGGDPTAVKRATRSSKAKGDYQLLALEPSSDVRKWPVIRTPVPRLRVASPQQPTLLQSPLLQAVSSQQH